MNSLIFYNRVVQHEVYTSYSGSIKNFHKLIKLTRLVATITPRQHTFSRVITLLAVLQIIFNKRASIKFVSVGGVKKICALSQFSKSSRILDLKDNIFNFTFFKQQRLMSIEFDSRDVFFFNIHPLMFSVFAQYYRFVFNIPRLRISLQVNVPSEVFKVAVFGRFLRLPSR